MLRRWPRGSYNHWIVVLGVNGCGKTTRAKAIAMSHAKAGARVFIFDPDGQFAPWPKYRSVDEWRKRSEEARKSHVEFPTIARFESASPVEVINLGEQEAERSGFQVPSFVVIDEGSAMYDTGTRKGLDKHLAAMITRRRNKAIGCLFCYQYASMLHRMVIANSTEIHLMRIEDRMQTDQYIVMFLPDPVTLTDGRTVSREQMLDALPRLPRGACYPVKKGF